MDKKELDAIIEEHGKWLNDEDSGERADLRGADLRGADLQRDLVAGDFKAGK